MASVLLARTGRHQQRYDAEKLRLVAGCIPYRVKKDGETLSGDLIDRLEVVMIATPNRHDLVFPKGGWENDESILEAACREALEEAGVRGKINEIELGVWKFRSKSRQNSCSPEGTCRGFMFALEVTEVLDCWPEQDSHERRWVNVREAKQLCRYGWMCEALDACIRYLSGKSPSPVPELAEPSSYHCVKPPMPEICDSPINALC